MSLADGILFLWLVISVILLVCSLYFWLFENDTNTASFLVTIFIAETALFVLLFAAARHAEIKNTALTEVSARADFFIFVKFKRPR